MNQILALQIALEAARLFRIAVHKNPVQLMNVFCKAKITAVELTGEKTSGGIAVMADRGRQ